jgi:hypothetical protein
LLMAVVYEKGMYVYLVWDTVRFYLSFYRCPLLFLFVFPFYASYYLILRRFQLFHTLRFLSCHLIPPRIALMLFFHVDLDILALHPEVQRRLILALFQFPII